MLVTVVIFWINSDCCPFLFIPTCPEWLILPTVSTVVFLKLKLVGHSGHFLIKFYLLVIVVIFGLNSTCWTQRSFFDKIQLVGHSGHFLIKVNSFGHSGHFLIKFNLSSTMENFCYPQWSTFVKFNLLATVVIFWLNQLVIYNGKFLLTTVVNICKIQHVGHSGHFLIKFNLLVTVVIFWSNSTCWSQWSFFDFF